MRGRNYMRDESGHVHKLDVAIGKLAKVADSEDGQFYWDQSKRQSPSLGRGRSEPTQGEVFDL